MWLLPAPPSQPFCGSTRHPGRGPWPAGPAKGTVQRHPPWAQRRGRLTCSCSSASLVARSSSESELPDSEELSSLLRLLSVPLPEAGAAGAASAGTSAGSSGILANRISNTSWGEQGPPEGLDSTRGALSGPRDALGAAHSHGQVRVRPLPLAPPSPGTGHKPRGRAGPTTKRGAVPRERPGPPQPRGCAPFSPAGPGPARPPHGQTVPASEF